MIYGIYLNAAGALAESTRHAVISNNMANISTPGFKPELAVFRERAPEAIEAPFPFYATPMDALGGGLLVSGTYTQHIQGPIQVTDGEFDLAISGKGYFAVSDGTRTLYTRAGGFMHDSEGRLVMPDGRHYLADVSGKALVIPTGGEVQIADDGTVSIGGDAVAKVSIFEFDDESLLTKEGANLYDASAASARPGAGRIRQGAIETSAVSAVKEMANMLMAMRAYEANMQMIKMQDQTLADLMTVGRVNI